MRISDRLAGWVQAVESNPATYVVSVFVFIGALNAVALVPSEIGAVLLQTIGAVALLLVGSFLLVRTAMFPVHRLSWLVVVYVNVALAFGGLYYLIYLTAPRSFHYDLQVIDTDALAREMQVSEAIDSTLRRIELLHALQLVLVRDPASAEHLLSNARPDAEPTTLTVPLHDRDVSVEYDVMTPYPGAHGTPDPQTTLTFNDPREGATMVEISLMAPVQGATSESRYERLNELISAARQMALSQANLLLASRPVHIRAFSLPDFVYFSFVITASGEIKPATTWIRLLAVGQMLIVAGFAFRDSLNSARPGRPTPSSPSP